MPIPTPFHSRTSTLCESNEWRNWSGYLAAGTYEPSHEREYFAIRNAAGLIDITPLFKYDINGPDALALVNKIMTRDMSDCDVGQVFYSPWCDEHGKIIDDGTIWRLGQNHFRVTAADPNLRWFQDCGYGLDIKVVDRSVELAALALQGPNSRAILQSVFSGSDIHDLGYYRLGKFSLDGIEVTITRTGYTGDLGYELWIAAEQALELWDALVDHGAGYGLLPVGMVALDIARIETGLLLIEIDYTSSHKALTENRKSTPFEAGLGWTVALGKGPFIGRKALANERASGAKFAFVGLEIDWLSFQSLFAAVDLPPMVAARASREATPVFRRGGGQIGQVTSSTFSPILKKYVALATIDKGFAHEGTEVDVEIMVEYSRHRARARVLKLPFYDPSHKRA